MSNLNVKKFLLTAFIQATKCTVLFLGINKIKKQSYMK